MSLFVLSDTHLSESSGKPMDIFGPRWTDYTEKIQKNWLRVVSPGDTVVIPGDISWAMTLAEAEKDLLLLGHLPGRKILGRGNHDYYWTSLSKMKTFLQQKGVENIDFLQNNAFLCDGRIVTGTRGWYACAADAPDGADFEKITARELLRLEMSLKAGEKLNAQNGGQQEMITFFHFPPVFGDYVNRAALELLKAFGVKRVYYGHIHGLYNLPFQREIEGVRFTLAAADFLNFCPLIIN